MRSRRLGVWIRALFLTLLACAGRAEAHPLGNFTINHLSHVAFSGNSASVRYVLDMAEIPTYAAMRERDPSGKLSDAELADWANGQASTAASQLELDVDGQRVPLAVASASAHTRPGAGGLPTLYLVANLTGSLPAAAGDRKIAFTDQTFAGRLGWHDVLMGSQTEPTHDLTAYPNALLGSPRDRTAEAATLSAAGIVAVSSVTDAATAASAPAPAQAVVRSNQLADMLVQGDRGPWFILWTLVIALFLGALHALEPGHGKTLLAVSLVGARATVGQAAILAGSLTVAHTAGVLLLGLAIVALKGAFVPETIYPWITLVSGIVIAVIGARAVSRQLAARKVSAAVAAPIAKAAKINAHDHDHSHGAHTHSHAASHSHSHATNHSHSHATSHSHSHAASHSHSHGAHSHSHGAHSHSHGAHSHSHGDSHSHDHAHDHAHTHSHDDDEAHARSHAIPGTAPLKFGPTVWAAMSGGIAPCPAALVVLFAAIAQNVLVYGIVAIVVFSLGLAMTLTGLGIGVVRGASWLSNRKSFDRFVRYGPLASALAIATIGAVMVGQGAVERGFAVTPYLTTIVAALAIFAYAFLAAPAIQRRATTA